MPVHLSSCEKKNIFLRHFILVFTSKLQPVPSSAIFIFNRIGIWSSTQNSEKYKRILRVYWSWYLWCFGKSHLPVSKFSASSEVKTCCILRILTKQLVWSVFCMKILETMYLTGVVFCWAYTHLTERLKFAISQEKPSIYAKYSWG